MMVNSNLVGGIPTPLKNDGVKVSWDDDIPNIWKMKHVPNHQPVIHMTHYNYRCVCLLYNTIQYYTILYNTIHIRYLTV